jgi:copper chaperone CopZ
MDATARTAVAASSVRFMTTTVLHIEGMSCQNCVRHVTEALTGVDGVQSVVVSLPDKSATVVSLDALSVQAARIAVEDAGYSLHA